MTMLRPVCSHRDIRFGSLMTPIAATALIDSARNGALLPLLLALPVLLLLITGARCGALANA